MNEESIAGMVQAVVDRGEHAPLSWRLREPILRVRSAIGPKRLRALLRGDGSAETQATGAAVTDESRYMSRIGPYWSTAQSGQDVFVQHMTSGLQLDHYLEIGACHPVQVSNTYILEGYLGWSGLSVEIDPGYAEGFRLVRRNPCILSDATLVNYEEALVREGFPSDLGYLSVDIDPSFQSLAMLLVLPFSSRRFATITFEHDRYRSGSRVRDLQREILRHLGYQLVVGDVKYAARFAFEDWWVHPELVPEDRWRPMLSENVDPSAFLSGLVPPVP